MALRNQSNKDPVEYAKTAIWTKSSVDAHHIEYHIRDLGIPVKVHCEQNVVITSRELDEHEYNELRKHVKEGLL